MFRKIMFRKTRFGKIVFRNVAFAASAIASVAGLMSAAEQRKSPHDTASVTLDGKNISISYGRPYLKGRTVGGELAPYGQVWRTGADEATKLTTDSDLTIGDLKVPKGSYALFTIPNKGHWTLIVNKVADQWGAFTYDASQDLGRTELQVSELSSPVEQFTIALKATSANEARLTLEWENTKGSTTIKLAK
jgi:hypothetical protein